MRSLTRHSVAGVVTLLMLALVAGLGPRPNTPVSEDSSWIGTDGTTWTVACCPVDTPPTRRGNVGLE